MSNMLCKKYFGASNSANGFVNYFPMIFNKESCRRLYVIKGGPGTGKSRFMRDVADEAKKRGLGVKYYYCSSDANSLDGIIIEELGIGILDGTAPHVCEPTLVGAFEQIINLGDFWDEKLLAENKTEIEYIANKKSSAYKRAYLYLGAYGKLSEAYESLLLPCVDFAKLSCAADRLLHKLPKSEAPTFEVALTRGVGMNGKTKFDTYENESTVLFTVPNHYRMAHIILGELERKAKKRKMSLKVSFDPILPEQVDALMLCDAKMSFVVADSGEKLINPKRFIVDDALKEERDTLKRLDAEIKRVDELSAEAFCEIAEYHFALEEIYAAAMNFDKKEDFTAEFIKKLF